MKKRISALQIGTKPQGTQATLEAILSFENAIKEAQTDLVVMPEALLGGYPKGEIFGTRLGYRLPEGRESFKQYFDEAIAVPGPETRELADLAARLNTNLVIGVIEKQGFATPNTDIIKLNHSRSVAVGVGVKKRYKYAMKKFKSIIKN